MSPVVLRPGQASLADWRAVYRGAPVALDPVCRADVEAGAAALQAVRAEHEEARAENAEGGPTVVELLHKDGNTLPAGLVRLFVALKLASLAQGVSGVRWTVVQGVADCLGNDLLPAVPAQATDRLALSHLYGALTGAGEIFAEKRIPAAKALKKAGLAPLKLNGDERLALLSGAQLSAALALAGLFEAERILQSSLVAAALSTASAKLTGVLTHPRAARLRRHPGQIEIAGALRSLLAGNAAEPAGASPARGNDVPAAVLGFPQMGACLDLLRQAGTTLERAANAVFEERLVLWQTGEIIVAVDDPAPVAFAADLIALSLCRIGKLAERRLAAVSATSGSTGTATEAPGAKPPEAMAACFNAENAERLNHSDAGSDPGLDASRTASDGVRRLLPMAGTASLVIAIEFLAITAAENAQQPDGSDGVLAAARTLLRERFPHRADEGTVPAADLAAAADLVRSGALAAAAGLELPLAIPDRSDIKRRHLVGRTDRP